MGFSLLETIFGQYILFSIEPKLRRAIKRFANAKEIASKDFMV